MGMESPVRRSSSHQERELGKQPVFSSFWGTTQRYCFGFIPTKHPKLGTGKKKVGYQCQLHSGSNNLPVNYSLEQPTEGTKVQHSHPKPLRFHCFYYVFQRNLKIWGIQLASFTCVSKSPNTLGSSQPLLIWLNTPSLPPPPCFFCLSLYFFQDFNYGSC